MANSPRRGIRFRERGNIVLSLFAVVVVFIAAVADRHVQATSVRDEVSARAGEDVHLPCSVNREECGDYHSIKWYKENRRVFVYSPMAEFAKAEGELLDRAQLILDDVDGGGGGAQLKLHDIRTADEGEYKCEITFLDITKNCPVVQLVKLNTLAEPKYLNISIPDDKVLAAITAPGSVEPVTIGAYNEGQEMRLACESGGGKPIPRVTWYNGRGEVIAGKASSFEEPDGTGTGRNEIRFKLGRDDLFSEFRCTAENEAIADSPMAAAVQIDVNLRPERTEIIGMSGPVEGGTVVGLTCRTRGARPAAWITWYNGSAPFAETPTDDVALMDDQTYETQSRIAFVASRFENGELITCEANNPVLEAYNEEPERASVTVQVKYAPVVDISPRNITANETDEVMIYCTYDANPMRLENVRWYRDGQLLSTGRNGSDRYEGATVDRPSLIIRSVSKEDIGDYACFLENEVGVGESRNMTTLEAFYKPSVALRMDPAVPVSEVDRRNVTLFCDVRDGNPAALVSVRWYFDGELLKQLPLCDDNGQSQGLCDIDPSKLLLEHVSQQFHGNFSCQGNNGAGWSKVSRERELEIYYPPGKAFIRVDAEEVVKGDAITLTCDVDDLGRPEADRFVWMRGRHVVTHVSGHNWTIDPVTLQTKANISCVAVNVVGEGERDSIDVEVFAPPAFIQRLPPYTGAMSEAAQFSVQCQVECSPLCDVFWLKDGAAIADDDDRYTITSDRVAPNVAKNDFESVTSRLEWNIANWPGRRLDRVIDNANYTCASTGNLVRAEGVSSTTYFRVEYPPENIELSDLVITLEEGSSADSVMCTAEAYPEASYAWEANGDVVATDNLLFFDKGVSRGQGGDYMCVAKNRHGRAEMVTRIEVIYKPDCAVTQSEDDDFILLTCEASANPELVDFVWQRGGNETVTLGRDRFSVDGLSSTLRLELDAASFGTYFCTANNSMGSGAACEIDVEGIGLLRAASANIIVVVAIAAAGVVAILAVIVVVILLCKKRRPKDQYTNHKDMEDREKSAKPPTATASTTTAAAEKDSSSSSSSGDTNSTTTDSSESKSQSGATAAVSSGKSRHKWPLRPGVHVHVKGLHAMHHNNNGKGDDEDGDGDGGPSPHPGATASRGTSTSNRAVSCGGEADSVAAASTASDDVVDDGRAGKTSQDGGGGGGNKSSPDSQSADDKLYENLPFHGMGNGHGKQRLPHKQIVVEDQKTSPVPNNLTVAPVTALVITKSSRPSSQLSQNGSSGYGSTRSQAGRFPSLATAKCGNKSPTTESDSSTNTNISSGGGMGMGFKRITWGSMRGFTHKKLESAVCRAKQINPQFASLRIPNRVKAVRGNGGEEEERSPEVDRELSEEIDAGIDLIEAEVEEEKRAAAAAASATGLVVMALPADANGGSMDGGGNPVPAPRQPRESHPYMNMQQQSPPQPSPLVPNTLRPAVSIDGMQILTAVPYNPQLHSHQHLHHHHHNSHQSLPRGNNVNSGGGGIGGGNFLRDSSPAGTNSSSNTTTSSSVTYQPLPPQQHQQQQQLPQQAKFPGYPQYNTQHRLPTVSSGVYEKRPLGSAARSSAYPGLPGARPSYTTLGPTRSGSAMGGTSSQSQAAKQFDSYYYHPATLRPNHQNSNATSQHRGGGGGGGIGHDYADLSIQQQQQQQQHGEHHQHHPHLAGRGNTDYAVLHFNKTSDVGKEIDV